MSDSDQKYLKRKSAAHHEMFNSSQAPWGVGVTQGSVPQIKKNIDPDAMLAAGKKTIPTYGDPQQIMGDMTVQEVQNELSQ